MTNNFTVNFDNVCKNVFNTGPIYRQRVDTGFRLKQLLTTKLVTVQPENEEVYHRANYNNKLSSDKQPVFIFLLEMFYNFKGFNYSEVVTRRTRRCRTLQ